MEPRPWTPPHDAWQDTRALSPREAAKVLRTSPETVRKLIRDGRLAGVELAPRRWRTTRAACLRFLSGQ
jgi:excisionase family DNA binding protein